MRDLSPDVEDLFPTHGAIPERQQIGRGRAIANLAGRVREHGDALLLEPRKEGKSSVAGAAMEHIEHEGGVVAQVDCTDAAVFDAPSLGRAILRSVRAQGGHVSRLLEARDNAAKQQGRLSGLRRRAAAAEQAGVEEAGGLADVIALLPRLESVTLDEVLNKLGEMGEDRTVGMFLDELQEIATWNDGKVVQESLARFLRRSGRRVSMVVAGSDRSTSEQLFAEGQPLHWEFEPFPLPEIDRVDWHEGLATRFRVGGLRISAERIDQILAETHGQPQRTMLVAKQAFRETRDADETQVSWTSIAAAIEQARRHPSWNT